jgi:hypothetical protein
MAEADPKQQQEQPMENTGSETRKSTIPNDVEGGEGGGFTTQEEKIIVEQLEDSKDGMSKREQMSRMTALHGIYRPFFHLDIQIALKSVVATLMAREATMEITPEEKEKQKLEKEEK